MNRIDISDTFIGTRFAAMLYCVIAIGLSSCFEPANGKKLSKTATGATDWGFGGPQITFHPLVSEAFKTQMRGALLEAENRWRGDVDGPPVPGQVDQDISVDIRFSPHTLEEVLWPNDYNGKYYADWHLAIIEGGYIGTQLENQISLPILGIKPWIKVIKQQDFGNGLGLPGRPTCIIPEFESRSPFGPNSDVGGSLAHELGHNSSVKLKKHHGGLITNVGGNLYHIMRGEGAFVEPGGPPARNEGACSVKDGGSENSCMYCMLNPECLQ